MHFSAIKGTKNFSLNIYNKCKAKSFSEINDYLFPATATKMTKIWENYTAEQILAEPSLFSAELPYAYSKGGPITCRVLQEMKKIPHVWDVFTKKLTGHHIIIDSRIHNLELNDYPAIPGWHTDFAERGLNSSMQPDYQHISPTVKIYVINLSSQEGGVSNTEFIVEPIKLNIPKENVYLKLDEQINKIKPKTIKATDGEIFGMDQLSLHRATKTHAKGVRFFLRLAVLHDLTTTILQVKPQNEVRNQLQIYRKMPKEKKSPSNLNSKAKSSSTCQLIIPLKSSRTSPYSSTPILILPIQKQVKSRLIF